MLTFVPECHFEQHIFGGLDSDVVSDEAAALAAIPPLEACVNAFDYELVAQKLMPLNGRQNGWDYFASGADDEETLRKITSSRDNLRSHFSDLRLVACDSREQRECVPPYLDAAAHPTVRHSRAFSRAFRVFFVCFRALFAQSRSFFAQSSLVFAHLRSFALIYAHLRSLYSIFPSLVPPGTSPRSTPRGRPGISSANPAPSQCTWNIAPQY